MASAPAPSSVPRDIVVPGSVSNLGPGFDALSVAVQVYLRLTIVRVNRDAPDARGCLAFRFVEGPPLVGENRIERAVRLAIERFGGDLPGLEIEVRSDIPMRAGLGSSAAATIAGLRLYEAFTEPRPASDWLALASEIEGHPDNAAAALLGGLTVSCQYEDGRVDARAWPWPADLRLLIVTPAAEVETAAARKVLPETLPLRDAIFNLQRALLFVRALETGRYEDLRESLKDRWHQPTRQAFVPGLREALAIDHPAVLGVCLSGSGPSVAVLATERGEGEAAAAITDVYERLGLPYTIRTLSAHQPR
ncbi:MAG: homoserine kinase [Acidobacteria bacterium]|nr:homoserine kinase [Acidobacteriota bacterium]